LITRIFTFKARQFAVVFILMLMGSGCALLPKSDMKAPQVAMPDKWQGTTVTGSAVANGDKWWQSFNDPVLNQLIDRALRTNNDLAAAAIRVRRAQLKSGLTDTNLTPSVNATGNSGITKDLNTGSNVQNHNITGTLSYELDLWGRLAKLRESSRWEAEATEVDRQNTALALIGTTASAYWQIAYLNERIASSEAGIAYAEKTFDLVQAKYLAGAVSGIDPTQSSQTLETERANLTQLIQQLVEARNRLAILFDQTPENSVPELRQLPDGLLPTVVAGLPADILGRRPDLRGAELRLREYMADVDATRASFYPAISLTGSLGSSSTSLANILQNPVAALGVGLALPFVQWNTAKLNIKVSETEFEEAVVNFRQTLYKALSDVENALSANGQYQAEGVHLEQALALSKKAEQLAGIRYRAGATGVQAWLDEQERRRNAETSLLTNHLNRLNTLMKLYQAVGGDMG